VTTLQPSTNSKAQQWFWETEGKSCPNNTCPHRNKNINLVEMKNWVFSDSDGDVVKEFACSTLDSARRYARYWTRNTKGRQTITTWDGTSKLTIRNIKKNHSSVAGLEQAGPNHAVRKDGAYTYAEGIQVQYKNSNFFIFLTGIFTIHNKQGFTPKKVHDAVEHLWKVMGKECYVSNDDCKGVNCPTIKDTISPTDVRDFVKVTMQTLNTAIVEQELDDHFGPLEKTGKMMNCREVSSILMTIFKSSQTK